MATSGSKSINVTSDGLIKLIFSWTAGEQIQASNYTPVTWNVSISNSSNSAKISSEVLKHNIVKIDNEILFDDNVSINCNPNITRTLVSGVKNILHNANGSKTFSFEITQYFGPVYYPDVNTIIDLGTDTLSGSGTLNTIPRPSVLGQIEGFTIGNAITIPITKYNSNFTDTLVISIGSTTIKTISNITNNANVTFTTAEQNDCYELLPNVTAAVFTFTLTTKNGTTTLGSSRQGATGGIPSSIKPTISSVALSEAVSGIAEQFLGYVQNQSKINGVITASAGLGSEIASYKTTINETVYTSRTFTTGELINSGENTCSVIVTDKRGRTASASVNFNVIEYAIPYIASFSVMRANAQGQNADDGEYAKVNLVASISDVNNGNAKLFKLEYKIRDDYSWTTYQTYTTSFVYELTNVLIQISTDDPYVFRLTVTDYFNSDNPAVQNRNLSSAFVLVDFNASGKGAAFGGVSSRNAFQFFQDIYDKNDSVIRNGLAYYEAGGLTDVDTTSEELVLSTNGTPTSAFWYVNTMFYANKATDSNKCQIAFPYNQTASPCYRYKFNGTWSNWIELGSSGTSVISDNYGIVDLGNGLLMQWGRLSATPDTAGVAKLITFNFSTQFSVIPMLHVQPVISAPNACWTSLDATTSATQGAFWLYRTYKIATPCVWFAIGRSD